MAKKPTSKYSVGMVARIEAAAKEHGSINLGIATAIASEPDFAAAGITPRGVVMKVQSLGLPYEKVQRVTKAGEPVMQKAEMAQRVAEALRLPKGALDSLAKAEKGDLRTLLASVEALTDQPAE